MLIEAQGSGDRGTDMPKRTVGTRWEWVANATPRSTPGKQPHPALPPGNSHNTRGADKPLARRASRCRRTESTVLLERRVCSCAELQVFSCYRGWKEACQARRAISTTSRRELSSSFFFLQGKAPKEIHAILTETLGDHAPSYATVKNSVAQFKRGDFSTCDASRPGRPKTVTTPEIADQIHEIILEYRRISTKSTAEQLGISRERFGSIIYEDLDMRKLSANWVPKCLNADQKRQRFQSSEQLLEFFSFRRDPNDFLSRLLTMDETWLYQYDPETKQQSMEWRHSGSARPQKFRVQTSAGKVLASIFWDQDGILLIDYLPKGQTTNAEYYLSLLVQLKDILKEKRCGKFTKGVLFLHDNAPAHRAHATQKKLAYLGFQYLDHPPYSPDLAPSDYHLFPGLKKKQLKGRHSSSDAKVIAAAETWFDGQNSQFFWVACKS